MSFWTRLAGMALLGILMGLVGRVRGETPHLIGIHDDDFPSVNEWISRGPNGTSWITATEAIGFDPGNMSGKAYQAPAGTTIIARLNNGYNPQGTLPLKEHYADFAQRCANFVANSSGCEIWLIGNETNLGTEWPRRNGVPEFISAEDYAEAFKLAYHAIKDVRPDHKVIVQALAPWAGPYSFPGEVQPDNWVDYSWKMMRAITTGPDAVIPDGISLHINSRTYDVGSVAFGQRINAGGLPLEFGWGVHRDWIQWGIPRELWHLPLYATESNGRTYWSGIGWPEPGQPAYQTGWLQAVFTSVNDWNQAAGQFGMPIYRCVNMYRWCNCDGWSINVSANKAQILADVEASAALGYTWPNYGGNSVSIAMPTGTKLVGGVLASASSSSVGFEPANAFDGSVATRWESGGTAGTTFQHWLVADLGEARPISGYVVRHASSDGVQNANRNTLAFLVETSNTSATGPWTTNTVVRTSEPGQNGPTSTPLAYDAPHFARYVRLLINGSGRAASSQSRGRVQEFEIYLEEGAATPTPTPEVTPPVDPTPTEPPPPGDIIVEAQTVGAVAQLNPQPDATDDLAGKIATRLRGGFHPIVTNPADMEAAFTNGIGLAGAAGLIRDYPPDGIEGLDYTDQPGWSGFWILDDGQQVDLEEVRIFSGNAGRDGRVWHNADLYVTFDESPSADSTWILVKEEIKPATFGTPNPGTVEATRTRVYRQGTSPLWNSVTAMRLDLFATAIFGSNSFADSTSQTLVAPIIFEIDAYTSEATTPPPTPTPPTPTPDTTPTATPFPPPSPTPTPIPYFGLINGDMELPYNGSGVTLIANGWTGWRTGSSAGIRYGRATNNRYSGASSQFWDSPTGQQHDGGVYQVIDVTPGAHYRITARMKRWNAGTIQRLRFGYDLTGGIVGDAPTVVYKDLTAVRANHWAEYAEVVTATGPQITLFGRGGIIQNGPSSNQTYLDYVFVEQYPTANLPTPTPVTNKLTRPGFKGLSMPYYYPWTGNLFSEYVANEADELGVEMIRVEFVHELDGTINLAAYDQLVDRAASRGIEVLGLIDYASVPAANSAAWATQDFRNAFVARTEELVQHFHDRENPIRHWEIWNEPDLDVSSEGGPDWRIEPEPYGLLIIQSFEAIKAIDPDAVVIFGGISPKGFEYTQNYLRDVYESDSIQNYHAINDRYPWDVVAAHPYPEIFVNPIPGLANVMNTRIKEVMNEFGDEETPVWITELGWSSSAVSPANQAAYLTDAFLLLDKLVDFSNAAAGPYVERLIWFNYQDFGPVDKWGVVDDAFARKPSFQSYVDLGRGGIVAPPGTNLVFNGSFEDGFMGTLPSPAVGTGWTNWTSASSGSVIFGRGDTTPFDGLYAQEWSGTASHSAGVWQRVEVVPGEEYLILARMRRTDSAPGAWLEFGFDMTGGIAPEAASVQYTKIEGQGENMWVMFEESVIATGNHITLFSKGGHAVGSGEANRSSLDGVFLGKPYLPPFGSGDTWRISRISPVIRDGVAGLR